MPQEQSTYRSASNLGTKNLYLIDDDVDIRKSIHFLLSGYNMVVWPFSSASDFLDQLPDLFPAPILLDIRMPEIDGLDLLKILQERSISWPVIILTAHGDVPVAVRAMKLGAIEFLEKPFESAPLRQALDTAFEVLVRDQDMIRMRESARHLLEQLTRRERETLAMLVKGAANRDIAEQLGLSVRTVEMHRANALAKLNVKRPAQVMQLVEFAGLPMDMDGWTLRAEGP